MVSDLIYVNSDGAGLEKVKQHTAKLAALRGLTAKQTLTLQLLAEETVGMLRGLTDEHEAEFYVKTEGLQFRLFLSTDTTMTASLRKKLLSASSSGANAVAKGVGGRLRDLFERIIEPRENYLENGTAWGWKSIGGASDSDSADVAVWSLSRYKTEVGKEAWDALEQSVIEGLSDEVEFAIIGDRVRMTVCKNFEQTEKTDP